MTAESIGKAFGVAALGWSVFYLSLVHIFVLWKWDSYSVSPRSRAAALHQMQQAQQRQAAVETTTEIRTVEVDDTATWSQTIAATRDALHAAEADMDRIQVKQAQLQTTLEQMNDTLDNLAVKEKTLTDLESELSSLPSVDASVFRDGTVPPEESLTFRLEKILSFKDLGLIDDIKDLQEAFTKLSKAMDEYLQEAGEDVQWEAINNVLQKTYPQKSSDISACPDIPEDDEQGKASSADLKKMESESGADIDAAPAVTEEDVEKRINEILENARSLYKETDQLPVSDETAARLEKVQKQLADEWMERVQEAFDDAALEAKTFAAQQNAMSEEDLVSEVVDEEDDDVKCAKSGDVLAVLEAGIEAVHRNRDLRDALHKAMSDRDPELRSVILDADLPLGESRPSISGPVTLRQYLDTALLANDVPEWIHAIVDAAGGHNDELDKIIDTWPENVGEVAVQKLLDLAGQVNLSKIQGQVSELFA